MTSHPLFPLRSILAAAAICVLCIGTASAQTQAPKIVFTPQETNVRNELKGLRDVPDQKRGARTTEIAAHVSALPASLNKLRIADSLAGLSTEGDLGHDTLQAVATTLASALAENPIPGRNGKPASPYLELASLVQYEHVTTTISDPQYDLAVATLQKNDADVQAADFTLTDLRGKQWTLSALRGKVVLVNFWATWCPPCRKEMPDLDGMAGHFKKQGLVVLSLSDEEKGKVAAFIDAQHYSYPILLDPDRKVATLFHVDGIPKSFIFDRTGKLVAQSIDMRTKGQFLQMLALADIK